MLPKSKMHSDSKTQLLCGQGLLRCDGIMPLTMAMRTRRPRLPGNQGL